ncbi:hypothetical protein DM02DRAFT_392665 [Periconia macrospinosa]|uniref:Uncharacterized protein n=1 Tax=Periconia macrospinosa TaxID=97972 RepID=A0A2V1D0B3_9PLEO|nr:hypothetical protein DM02DRAFT_392665 [Periconia macrospinosa]
MSEDVHWDPRVFLEECGDLTQTTKHAILVHLDGVVPRASRKADRTSTDRWSGGGQTQQRLRPRSCLQRTPGDCNHASKTQQTEKKQRRKSETSSKHRFRLSTKQQAVHKRASASVLPIKRRTTPEAPCGHEASKAKQLAL